mgnify:FL=1
MAQSEESHQRFWADFHGPNMGYIEEQYELYKADPEAVDPTIKDMFDRHGAPEWLTEQHPQLESSKGTSIDSVKKLTSAMKLVEAIRRFGHLEADIYPVGLEKKRVSELVKPETYGLTEDDLRNIPAAWLWEKSPGDVENGLDVINKLKKYYSGTITFEYDHVNNDEGRQWLLVLIESGNARLDLSG